MDTREQIMELGRSTVQAHGYGGLSFRELAKAIGIKSASIHYHFPAKADLGAALVREYCASAKAELAAIWDGAPDAPARLKRYAAIFRRALEDGNRMCLAGFLAAEHLDLPEAVQREVEAFIELNVAWIARVLGGKGGSEARARAIYAAIAGAQLVAHGKGDARIYDEIVKSYRAAGLLPN
jgi:TetR/AcrR family transcriptional repressor of nem operon